MSTLPNTPQNEMANNSFDPLDELLESADDDILEEETDTVYELTEDDFGDLALYDAKKTSSVLADSELSNLELSVTKHELYEDQKSAAVATTTLPAPTKPGNIKRTTSRSSSAGASTRIPRDIGKVADEFFVLTGDISSMSDDDKKAARDATMKLVPSQVKVAEKFENLFTSLSVGKEPSVYVMTAFKLLDDRKMVTSADIVGAYKASGLGEGTARSQAGQIMNLFATVGIATRTGQSLSLRTDSVIADRLRALKPSAS